MIRKFTKCILVGILTHGIANGQALKTYKGTYKLGYASGEATYTYKEKDYQQIKHGSFEWKQSISYRGDYVKEVYKGQFLDGKLNGSWSHRSEMSEGGTKTKIEVLGEFKSNVPNGLFKMSRVISNSNGTATINTTVNYKMGQMVGDVNLKTSVNAGNVLTTGHLNETGVITGEFLVKEGTREDILKSDQSGVLELIVSRSNGRVTENKNFREQINDVPTQDIFYDTLRLPLEWYQTVLNQFWKEAGFEKLEYEGMMDIEDLGGPYYIVARKKGGLKESGLTDITEWVKYLDKITNTEDCLSQVFDEVSAVIQLEKQEKDKLEKLQNGILSSEIVTRDSIIRLNQSYYSNLLKFNNLSRDLRNKNDSMVKVVNNRMDVVQMAQDKIEKCQKLRIGEKTFMDARLPSDVITMSDDLKRYSERLNNLEILTDEELQDGSEACHVKVSLSNIEAKNQILVETLALVSYYEGEFDGEKFSDVLAVSEEAIEESDQFYTLNTKIGGLRNTGYVATYKGIMESMLSEVNDVTFVGTIQKVLPHVLRINNTIEEKISEPNKLHQEITASIKDDVFSQRVRKKYDDEITTWCFGATQDSMDLLKRISHLGKWQRELKERISQYNSNSAVIRSKIEEGKHAETILAKYEILRNGVELSDNYSDLIFESFDRILKLQASVISILNDANQTKVLAKDLKKIEDIELISEKLE